MTPADRTRAYRARIMADPAEIELRRREYIEKQRRSYFERGNVLPTAVLQDWHTDEHGCRARTVGNVG